MTQKKGRKKKSLRIHIFILKRQARENNPTNLLNFSKRLSFLLFVGQTTKRNISLNHYHAAPSDRSISRKKSLWTENYFTFLLIMHYGNVQQQTSHWITYKILDTKSLGGEKLKTNNNNFSDHLMKTRTNQGYFFRIVYCNIIKYISNSCKL